MVKYKWPFILFIGMINSSQHLNDFNFHQITKGKLKNFVLKTDRLRNGYMKKLTQPIIKNKTSQFKVRLVCFFI